MSRLEKTEIKLPRTGAVLDRVFTYTLESMDEAATAFRESLDYRKTISLSDRQAACQQIIPAMMNGDAATLPAILEAASALELAAVEIDPRLGARPGWVRSAEGLDLDAGLLAAGEENCCFDRRRQQQSERQASAEPVRIVISTDTSAIPASAAAAFVAAARLAAQFVPLEIWWQGSWMLEGETDDKGHVFHVPLVRAGEMDFSRLQFVLCDSRRDVASFQVMFRRVYPAGLGWGGGRLEYSTLPGTTDFIPATGLRATAESVASKAARWAGMVSAWEAEYNEQASTLQSWEPAKDNGGTVPAWQPTAEQKARWAANDARAADEKRRVASERQERMQF